jgi:ABC-type bacteriocin/lantibiotic exporter with double-glycine peptidase domain
MAAAVMYFSTQYTFLIPFFMGSVIAYLSFWNFHLIYRKLQDQMENEKKRAAEEQENELAELTDSERDRNQ